MYPDGLQRKKVAHGYELATGRVRLEGVSSGSNGCATEGLLYDLSNLRRAATTCLLMLFVLPICGLEPAGFARCSNRRQSTNNSAIPRGLEKSVRSVLYAIYSNDAETLRKWIVPESDSDDLLGLAHLTAQHLKELRQEVGAMQLSQVSLHGRWPRGDAGTEAGISVGSQDDFCDSASRQRADDTGCVHGRRLEGGREVLDRREETGRGRRAVAKP